MIRALFKKKVAKNAAWIIACKLIQAVLGLVISMLTARYLGPAYFGVVNYAQSLVTFITPVAQLGLTSTMVHELVNHPEQEGEIVGTAIAMSAFSSLLCIAGLMGYVRLSSPGEPETVLVCGLYSLVLLMQSLELIQYWFQEKLLSKYSAILTLCAYTVMSAYQTYLLVTRKPVAWFALSKTLEYGIIAAGLLLFYHRLSHGKLRWNARIARRMLAHSWHYMVSFLMVMTFAQADRIMIKRMMGNTAMGYYSAAVVCANMTDFVFLAIIDSLRPVILEDKLKSQRAYEKGMSLLYCIVIYLALLQSVVITLLAQPIVNILYGQAYAGAVRALRIIVWYTAFSYIGTARTVWILGERKEKTLLLINFCGAAANIGLNLLLIPRWGIEGAALASLVTQMFANWGIGYLLPEIRGNNRLIWKGLNPRLLLTLAVQNQQG